MRPEQIEPLDNCRDQFNFRLVNLLKIETVPRLVFWGEYDVSVVFKSPNGIVFFMRNWIQLKSGSDLA